MQYAKLELESLEKHIYISTIEHYHNKVLTLLQQQILMF